MFNKSRLMTRKMRGIYPIIFVICLYNSALAGLEVYSTVDLRESRLSEIKDESTQVIDNKDEKIETTKISSIDISKPASTKPQELTFDPVDANHIALIAARLKIIEKLILEHKRAYDYRSITTSKLKEILNSLETTQ